MLKTTIELGNVGQFASKPSRAPVPSKRHPSQSSERPRHNRLYKHGPGANGSAISLLDPANRPASRNGPDGVGRSHHSQASPGYGMRRTHGQHRKASLNPSPGSADDSRTYSLTPSSGASQTVVSQPLSAHMHLRSYERLPGARSRSPYPFATAPRGPRNRPVSPAYSDSQGSYSRPPYGASRARDHQSPSPVSTYRMETTPLDWHATVDHWNTRQNQSGHRRPIGLDGHSPVDASTSKMHPTQRVDGVQGWNDYGTDLARLPPGSWPTEEWTPAPAPLFYDYSEAFQEQTYYRTYRAVAPVTPQSSFRRYESSSYAHMYHELPGELTRPASVELPAPTSTPDLRIHQRSSGSKVSGPYVKSAPQAGAELAPMEAPSDSPPFTDKFDSPVRATHNRSTSSRANETLTQRLSQSTNQNPTTGHQSVSSCKHSQEPMSPSGRIIPPETSDQAAPAKGSSTSSSASMYSLETHRKSSVPRDRSTPIPAEQHSKIIAAQDPPRLESTPESSRNKESGPCPLETIALRTSQIVAAPVIHAPIPERSISSPSQKQRFSQILSLEEDPRLPDLPPSPTKSQSQQGISSTLSKEIDATFKMPKYRPTPRTSSIHQAKTLRPDSGIGLPTIDSSKDATVSSHNPEAPPRKTIDEIRLTNRTSKDLPSLPHVLSTASLTPSLYVDPAAIRDDSVKSLALSQARDLPKQPSVAALAAKEMEELPPIPPVPPLKFKLKGMKSRKSTSSLADGRPWNQDESYPWTSDPQELGIKMPRNPREELQDKRRLSKFKLRAPKRSGSTSDTVKITKSASSSTPLRRFSGANDLFRGPLQRYSKQLTGKPSRNKRASVHSKFVESFVSPPPNVPSLTLVSPSSELSIEVKDFFDDKGSQAYSKSSLRKKLSGLKSTAGGEDRSRITHGAGQMPSLLPAGEGRTSKRSSVLSTRSFDSTSRSKGVRARFVRKIKGWVLRGEDRIHAWRARRRAKKAESLHSVST